jgi:bifunctional non-homologous end joining protein LigD
MAGRGCGGHSSAGAREKPCGRAGRSIFRRFRGLELADCPFVNLPEAKSGRWGQGLTTEKMKECRWLKPQ